MLIRFLRTLTILVTAALVSMAVTSMVVSFTATTANSQTA